MSREEWQTRDCDVLVVGGGLAGCWSAIRAAQVGARVILVDRAKVGRSGKSSFAGCGILCPEPGDDLDVWQKEIVEAGKYIADQDWVRIDLEGLPQLFEDMTRWGIPFERDEKGKLSRRTGMGSHLTRFVNVDAFRLVDGLKSQLLSLGVDLCERTMVTDLLTSDGLLPTRGSACGAVGFETTSGEPRVFHAGAVILASGGTAFLDLTADGVAQGVRAGAEAMGFEFTRFCSFGLARKYPDIQLLTFQSLGMVLRNSKGERFMERYQPLLKEAVTRQEMYPALVAEALAGRGPIYMDLTHLSPEALRELRTSPTTDVWVGQMEAEGLDFGKDLVEFHVSSGVPTTAVGGLRHSIFGETSIPGLYVAGDTGGFPGHGAFSVGSFNTAQCCVEGHRAGENAARYAREYSGVTWRTQQDKALVDRARRPLRTRGGRRPGPFINEIHKSLAPGDISVFKTRKSIERALAMVDQWQQEAVASTSAADWHEMTFANKVENYLLVLRLVFMASLSREESRGCHIRPDYPYQDDRDWLKWVVLRSEGDSITERLVPVPIYRYPVKPDKYDRKPITTPLPEIKD